MTTFPTSQCSLSLWLEHWIETYAPLHSHSRKTIERYGSLARYVSRGATPELANIAGARLGDLRHVEIENALLSLMRMRGERRERLSTHTVLHVASLLRVALGKAYRLDLIAANPMLKVELPQLERREVRALTPEEIHRLRDTCRMDWTFPFIELALATGCRRGELLALNWSDANSSTRVLRVSKSLEQTADGLRLKLPKSGRTRLLTLPRTAIQALRDYRRVNCGALIFRDRDGSYLEPDLVSQVIVRRLRKAGIADASLHTLRHTHASILLSRGVPLPAIAARLGHSDPNTTARIYCHMLPPDEQRAADEWDTVMGFQSSEQNG
jgi:integrase